MIYNIISVFGTSLVLLAFLLLQLKKVTISTPIYNWLNFIGSTLLVAYALNNKSYPFVILNVIWGLVALKALIKR